MLEIARSISTDHVLIETSVEFLSQENGSPNQPLLLGDVILQEDGTTNTPNSSTEGKLFFESGASYATTSFDDKVISTDSYANNVGIETVADSILDFTEGNPFSEGTGY